MKLLTALIVTTLALFPFSVPRYSAATTGTEGIRVVIDWSHIDENGNPIITDDVCIDEYGTPVKIVPDDDFDSLSASSSGTRVNYDEPDEEDIIEGESVFINWLYINEDGIPVILNCVYVDQNGLPIEHGDDIYLDTDINDYLPQD